MGNQPSSTSSKRRGNQKPQTTAEQAAERAKRVVGDLQEGIKNSVKKLDDDHPAAQLLDHVCGTYYHDDDKYRNSRTASYYSEEVSEDGSRTFQSEDDTTYDGRRGRKSDKSVDSQSYVTQSDYDSDSRRRGRGTSFDTEDESRFTHETEPKLISKPLASSFAKRCYFTKSGIGKTTQHYEGLTLTGNVVLMLASAMKLKGCPTICDEDLRRVEQTYPNQFSRLPDELLLSSGWRRISKYCHFSNKSIPDGIPFFHSKQRLHPSGGYYFLVAGSVGMIRPIDVEPLTKDTLVLLETDFPNQCDATPSILIRDPAQWVLVNKFCFFSGGPINTEEDVYYQADFDGNPIFMLAFLSPSLTPEELYKLSGIGPENEPGLKSVAEVQEVESVYDLTERDFDDLKLYHLGPCRALPQYILQPSAWTKVLPPHFLAARQQAMIRAQDYSECLEEGLAPTPNFESETRPITEQDVGQTSLTMTADSEHPFVDAHNIPTFEEGSTSYPPDDKKTLHYDEEEEGAFHSNNPGECDAGATIQETPPPMKIFGAGNDSTVVKDPSGFSSSRMDPPDDEPPSLKIESMEENENLSTHFDTQGGNYGSSPLSKKDVDDQGFFRLDPALDPGMQYGTEVPDNFSSQFISPVSESRHSYDQVESHKPIYTGERPSHSLSVDNFEEPPKIDIGTHQKSQRSRLENDQLAYNFKSKNFKSPHVVSDVTPKNFHHSDEKKIGGETDDLGSGLNDSKDDSKEDLAMTNNVSTNYPPNHGFEPIDTSYTKPKEYGAHPSSLPVSPVDVATNSAVDNRGHQSPAMRGAREILKRRRAEPNKSFTRKSDNQMISHAKIETPTSTRSEISTSTWDENNTDIMGSAVSGSSIVSEKSGSADRSSRRALILQMAKARMKNNRDSPSKASSITQGDEADDNTFTEGNATIATHDFDLTGDLD